MLKRIQVRRHSLDKATVTDRDNNPLVGNKVFLAECHFSSLAYLGPTRITIFLFQFYSSLFYKSKYSGWISQ